MKKIVVVSDIQLHNHRRWSSVNEDGINSRLMDGIRTLDQAVDLCGNGVLIVSGDFFHDSRAISIDVLSEASKWVARASEACEQVILAVGNHDCFRKSGSIHSLEPFRHSNVTIVDQWQIFWFPSGSKNDYFSARSPDPIFVAAYTENLEELCTVLNNQPDDTICILHQDVRGAVMNGGRISETGLTVEELERFKLVLLGHFHEHQKLASNTFYIGSPYQIDKGEMDQPKYIAVLEDGEVSWIRTLDVPEYKVVSYDEFRHIAEYGIHFWEVTCNDDERKQILDNPPVGANFEVTGEPIGVKEVAEHNFGSLTAEDAVISALERMGASDLIDTALERLSP